MTNDKLKKLLLALRYPIESASSNYSSTNSSKGVLLAEAKALFSYLARKNSLTSARRAVINDNLFAKRTYHTRKRCWELLHSRYFAGYHEASLGRNSKEHTEQIHPIIELFRNQSSETLKRNVLYYHFVTSDLFSYDTTVALIYDLYRRGIINIAHRDVHEFLENKTKAHPEISAWSPQTRRSLVSHYLSAMRDFGVLEGKVRKKIRRPTVEEDLLLYIVTYLRDCGKPSRDIVGSHDFRLFLLSQQEVEAMLTEVQLKGRIRFQRSGHIVSLELPWGSILEYIKNIGQ